MHLPSASPMPPLDFCLTGKGIVFVSGPPSSILREQTLIDWWMRFTWRPAVCSQVLHFPQQKSEMAWASIPHMKRNPHQSPLYLRVSWTLLFLLLTTPSKAYILWNLSFMSQPLCLSLLSLFTYLYGGTLASFVFISPNTLCRGTGVS